MKKKLDIDNETQKMIDKVTAEPLDKKRMKIIFKQIKQKYIAAATPEAVFKELCWVLTLQPADVDNLFDDFVPAYRYEMNTKEYAMLCEANDSKKEMPTLKEINKRRREDIIDMIVDSLIIQQNMFAF
jgi:hypothetical protein